MKLTALIPAYNDAYTLALCLGSIIDHFDEVLVLDDASTDETPDVAADFARRHAHVRFVRHEGRQLGWVEARNRLLTMTDARHLFWLDADDVLCEYAAPRLRAIAGGDAPVVRLALCEMWGDLNHTTQRLQHYDRCHVYVDRSRARELQWGGGTAARPETGWHATNSGGPLLFHLKGVKPDRRLAERHVVRAYLRDPRRPARLAEAEPLREMTGGYYGADAGAEPAEPGALAEPDAIEAKARPPRVLLVPGAEVIVKREPGDLLLGATRDDWKEAEKLLVAKDWLGAAGLLAAKKAVAVAVGDRLKVIETAGGLVRVRVQSGESAGSAGWIDRCMIE